MLQYIFQVVLFQLLFLLIYDGFLKRETFFNYNRIYLLATVILSFLLPFVQLGVFENTVPQQLIIKLPEVVIGTLDSESAIVAVQGTAQTINQNIWQWHYLIYIGMLLATLMFITKLVRLVWLIENNPKRWQGDILLIKLIKSNAAFSFFNRVFMGEHIHQNDQQTILKHEMVHVQHKHSLDLLIFEILRIVMWFNPLVYLYQNRIIAVHEFIADAEATKHQDKQVYYQNLLAQVFDTNKISFINPFFKQSLIKKRIVMLSKSKSKSVKLFKYALLIPMVLGMIIYASCTQESLNDNKTNNQSLSEKIRLLNSEIDNKDLTQEDLDAIDNLQLKIYSKFHNVKHQSSTFEIEEIVEELSIEDLNTQVISKEDEIPFAEVERVPAFKGCESLETNQQLKECTSKEITLFVNKNFDTSIGTKARLTGRQRISAIFKIDSNGEIKDVQVRAPHPLLEVEAKRVISLMPKMTPGKQKGENITVQYGLPIIFQILE